ncbi:cysteine protease [Trypanosoma grayi]|uniref:cysteine protease n=1 Tax=Trypanosoma grayi TaxID=71804 RepID=UPI0004F40CDC|nr:cysteine protease [Trypanosoma grayi]KEG13966.1 cysteine protease [Trypanosoma grayi]
MARIVSGAVQLKAGRVNSLTSAMPSSLRNLLGAVVLLVAAATVTLPAHAAFSTEDLSHYTFDMYLKDFNKRYDDPNEYRKRSEVFQSSLSKIAAFNKIPGRSYQLGVNKFSDLTNEEFKTRFTGRVTTPRLHGSLRRKIYNHKGAAVPDAMTWQDANPPVLTPVKDQGGCGSCWAHAATESVESMYAIGSSKLLTLSTQQITSCTNNSDHCGGEGGCSGGTAQLAWEYIRNASGIALEEDYPYVSGTTTKTEECIMNASTPSEVKVYGYVSLPHNDYNAVVEALVTKGPLAVSVDASEWQFYTSGIFDICGKNNQNITINHAVQLVGYGTNETTKQDFWIVRNSWDERWGENGYIRLLRKKTDDVCVLDNGWNTEGGGCENDSEVNITACGMCGILYDVSYPQVFQEPEKGKLVWIAGAAFGALGVLMIGLVVYSKCFRAKKSTDVSLLDESESLN